MQQVVPRAVALALALALVAVPLAAMGVTSAAMRPGGGAATAGVGASALGSTSGRRRPAVHAIGRLDVRGQLPDAVAGGPWSSRQGSNGTSPDILGPSAGAGTDLAPPGAGVEPLAVPDPVAAASSGQPAPTTIGFDGLDDAAGGVFAEPSDSWVAVNAGFVGQVVNGGLRFTSRAGAVMRTTTIPAMFGFASSFPGIDDFGGARLAWDAANGRWVLTVAAYDCNPTLSKGYLFGAVSRTADPVGGGWNGFWLDYTDTKGTAGTGDDVGILPAGPALGGSTDKVAIGADEVSLTNTADCLAGSAFVAASVTIVDWSSLGAQPLADFPVGYFATSTARGWRPALPQPATTAAVPLLVETAGTGTTSNVGYASLTGRVTSGSIALSAITDLTAAGTVAAWTDPPAPADPGGAIGSGVLRRGPSGVILQGSRLTAVADTACTPSGDTSARACVRVTELDVSASPSLVADVLFAGAGSDTFGGGIGRSVGGALHVVYAQSSSSLGISAWTRYRGAADAATAFSQPLRLASGGETAYSGDDWGDSLGLAQDPVDREAAWVGGPYTAADGGWATWVAQLQTPGATFVPIQPVRVLDSRFGTGLSGGFAADQPRTWQVTGVGGVPANAIAVTGNVTVTEQTGDGWVTVSPTPTTDASPSTINFPIGDNRANNVTIVLGPGGTLSAVYKAAGGRTTHLIFDVTGYFVAAASGATYHPVTPSRSLDSRYGTGLSGSFTNGVARTWQVSGRNGVPGNAVAVTGNVTVTGQQSAGYVAVTPQAMADPSTSTLNFPVGDDRANGITVALGPGGTLSAVFRGGFAKSTHLIFDVTGYYVADLSGARFVPLVPGRVLDSRFAIGLSGKFAMSVPRLLAVGPGQGIPPNATAFTGNLTVVNQTWAGYVSLTQAPTSNPETSTVNFPAKDVRANGVTAPLGPAETVGLVYLGGSAGTTDLVLDVTGYFR